MLTEWAVRQAICAWLQGDIALMALVNGVFDQATQRVTAPYVIISDSLSTDWSVKDRTGREVRMALTVHDDGDDAARLGQITDQILIRLNEIPAIQPHFEIAALQYLRSRTRRGDDRRWQVLIEFRVRLLEP